MLEESRAQSQYQRLYISSEDLHMASAFATHLLKKGLHYAPWERRWSTYVQQAAFTSAFITSYARPFTHSRGWPAFPSALITYTARQRVLHGELLALRHQVYAHSDSSRFNVRPMRIASNPSALVGAPLLRLTKGQLERGLVMIDKLQEAIALHLERLLVVIEAPGSE